MTMLSVAALETRYGMSPQALAAKFEDRKVLTSPVAGPDPAAIAAHKAKEAKGHAIEKEALARWAGLPQLSPQSYAALQATSQDVTAAQTLQRYLDYVRPPGKAFPNSSQLMETFA